MLANVIEQQGTCPDGGDGICYTHAFVFGCRTVDRLEHRCPLRVDVAARCQSHSPLDHRAEIGDDVAEHVGRDNDIEPLWVLHKPHGDGIDEVKLGRYAGIFFSGFREYIPPQPVHI